MRRIIAVEGDVVRTRDDKRITIPVGHCWVESHRPSDTDSDRWGPVRLALTLYFVLVFGFASLLVVSSPLRNLGSSFNPEKKVPMALIGGRAVMVMWPPGQTGFLERKDTSARLERVSPKHRNS